MTAPRRGLLAGLAAAALFGASTPLAKLLLPGAGPLLLSGLFYLGAAGALSLAIPLRRRLLGGAAGTEAQLSKGDLPLLAAVLVLGGVLGPLLMLWGLSQTSGFAGALLLNLEAPATLGLALLVFGEHVGRPELIAAAVITAGAAVLSGVPGPDAAPTSLLGALSIAGACLAWGLDNNLTQRLSLRDPLSIARAKTLGAGAFSLVAALALGSTLPPWPQLLLALGVGALGYGASLALDVVALRELGAAREAAIFATAPFAGALLSVPLLGDRPGLLQLGAAGGLLFGVWLLARARHGHAHSHAPLSHDHKHEHDEHHQHGHEGLDVPRDPSGKVLEPHAHPHRHVPLVHDHPHVSDVHHRHEHKHEHGHA
jgi:drug/metabolite transporter (DMT)-like permease